MKMRFAEAEVSACCRNALDRKKAGRAVLSAPRIPSKSRITRNACGALRTARPTLIGLGNTAACELLLFLLLLASSTFAVTNTPPSTNILQTSRASTNDSPAKFDALVRPDFFQGIAGNREAFERAMKLCDETLAENPKHAQAMVWHGSGLLFLATQAIAAHDPDKSAEFWARGMREMDGAFALEPDNVGVLVPRGATLLAISRHTPDPAQGKTLLKMGIADYEKALELQKPIFRTLPLQARGELLFGLADGWHRLQNLHRARVYFQRVIDECEGSPFAQQAKIWFDNPDPDHIPDTPGTAACIHCHSK